MTNTRKRNKMTKREFLQAVIATETVAVNVKEFAQSEIKKLDARNASRSSKPTKAQIENEPIKKKIVELLTEVGEKYVASAIAEKVEISTQKASALCRQLVDEGKLQVEEVKVPKKGRQKAYSVIAE